MWGSPPCIPLVLAAAWGVLGGFSPDGSLIAAGDGDPFANDKTGTIRLYSTATGDPFGSPLRGHTDRVWSVCFSSDGKQLTTGSQDKTVRNWDLATRASLS